MGKIAKSKITKMSKIFRLAIRQIFQQKKIYQKFIFQGLFTKQKSPIGSVSVVDDVDDVGDDVDDVGDDVVDDVVVGVSTKTRDPRELAI